MIGRFHRWVRFRLERFLLGGSHYRLLFLAGSIGLISLVAGWALWLEEGARKGMDFGEAVWWAFLRLTDPGYLGDDEGAFKRTVSTIVTVLGYVFFMGALIAIMTQWLNETIRRLEKGLTPVSLDKHIVVIGWTDHTPELVGELLSSETRLRNFLVRFGAHRLRVAVLAEEVGPQLDVELREHLGWRYRRDQIILRSGSPQEVEALQRVDFTRAATVIVAGDPETDEAADADAHLVGLLLTMRHACGDRPVPYVVAQVTDARKVAVVESAYPDGKADLLATTAIIGRLLAQNLRHPGLSRVLDEILTQIRGNEIYLHPFPEFDGCRLGDLAHAFEDAVVIGVLEGAEGAGHLTINPHPDGIFEPDARLVLLADDYEVTVRPGRTRPLAARRGDPPIDDEHLRRLLVLGWNRSVPYMLLELASHADGYERIDLLSTRPADWRRRHLDHHGFDPDRLPVEHVETDFTIPSELARFDLAGYDAVMILGSDRAETAGDADARSLLAHQLVRDQLSGLEKAPVVVVELKDPGHAHLFQGQDTEVLPSGLMVAHVLSQVALRPELREVFDALLGPGGSEIAFRSPADYGIGPEPVDFDTVIDIVGARGDVALGLELGRGADARLFINPDRKRRFALGPQDRLIVLGL